MTGNWNTNRITGTQLGVCTVVRVPAAREVAKESMGIQDKGFILDAHDPGGSDG